MMSLKDQATEIFKSTLKHVNPQDFLPEILSWNKDTRSLHVLKQKFDVPDGSGIYVIGTGKASPTMATACENILGNDLSGGMIIAPPDSNANPAHITMLEGSHPLPDKKSYEASKKMLEFIEKIPEDSIVINVLSGGTSSLLCMPADDLNIEEIRDVYRLLLESGASIHEVNTVRKALSQVKGGQLLERLNHTTLLDLVISDVPDDDLRYIGSGPTTSQEISFIDAREIAEKYNILNKLPDSIKNHITKKCDSEDSLITKDIENHHSWIVSSASKVVQRTIELLNEKGFETEIIHPAWTGLIQDFENKIFDTIQNQLSDESEKRAIVFFGECTVKVTGNGLGGRNQELALRMAKRLKDSTKKITFLSAGTDGIDGPTDAAGAVVDQNTWKEAVKDGMDPQIFIDNNDSYHFFNKAGGHIFTGPTGNNVMDIQIVLMD